MFSKSFHFQTFFVYKQHNVRKIATDKLSFWRGNNIRKSSEELNNLFRNSESFWIPINSKFDLLAKQDTKGASSRPLLQIYKLASSQAFFKESLVLDENAFFLGTDPKGIPYFTVLPSVVNEQLLTTDSQIKFINYRSMINTFDNSNDHAIISQAKSIVYFHTNFTFCSKCGSKTHSKLGGSSRQCTNCKIEHYPRIDTCVIMLVHHDDKVLLGRQPIWDKGRYSVLAGFMEPGESVEESVAREVLEESGIKVDRTKIRYFGSQSWPFPSSLMIGCFAEAVSTEIKVDKEELEDAKWFSREDIKIILQGGNKEVTYGGNKFQLSLPPSFAISNQLIRNWANK